MWPKINLIAILWVLTLASCSDTQHNNPDPISPTEYHTSIRLIGDTANVEVNCKGGVCLMGGSTDVDSAFKWMIQRASGGDFVVLRADVSYAYNPYIYRLGKLNSVETIVIDDSLDTANPAVIRDIRNADALFIAGGDQADYVRIWKNSRIRDAINYLINVKNAPVGGTSAGCAILGQFYFSALNGVVMSNSALSNPFSKSVTLGNADFINHPLLKNFITDQHYSQRNRSGRLIAFMARLAQLYKLLPRAIAVDEETAVCISPQGEMSVVGKNKAFVLQANSFPDTCMADKPLSWDCHQHAVTVFRFNATSSPVTQYNLLLPQSVFTPDSFYFYVRSGLLYSAVN